MTKSHLRTLIGASAAVLLLLTSCSNAADDDGPGPGGGDLPAASGEFGDAPEFTWPESEAPATLEVEALSVGEGPEVEEGSYVVANYAGHVWGSDEPFDSSYDRGEPAQFPLEGVVDGWREGIPGHTVGSRLLISIPPEQGYGSAGNPDAGIGGEDTIVFVVDLIETFDAESLGEADATAVELPEEVPVTVEGDLGERFTVTVQEGAEEPDEPQSYALSQGSGEKVAAGDQVVIAYTLTTWDNDVTESSWMPELGTDGGPQTVPVGAGTALDLVEGYEVGSRVLMTQVAAGDVPAMVIVADIIAAY